MKTLRVMSCIILLGSTLSTKTMEQQAENCPICLDSLAQPILGPTPGLWKNYSFPEENSRPPLMEPFVFAFGCGHEVHGNCCMRSWAFSENNELLCPLCRTELVNDHFNKPLYRCRLFCAALDLLEKAVEIVIRAEADDHINLGKPEYNLNTPIFSKLPYHLERNTLLTTT